jgi:hypothetical protein
MFKTYLLFSRRIVWRFGHLDFRNLNLPFDLAQGGESFDSAQDREPVERLVEPFRISFAYVAEQ